MANNMATLNVYTIEHKEAGTVEVPDVLVSTEWKPDLVHQVVVAQDANARQPLAHTKDRGDVRGGGKKPWRQKGTGRARHGSIRSPLWSGGGVTFGPRNEKIYAKKINKKMKTVAFCSVFAKKIADNELTVIDSFASVAEKPTTKEFAKNTKQYNGSAMYVFANVNKSAQRAARNIQKTTAMGPLSLNVRDLLIAKNIFIEKEAINELAQHHHFVQ